MPFPLLHPVWGSARPGEVGLTNLEHSDIAFYGVNLNQSVILAKIGYAKGPDPWTTLYNTAIGNIIVQCAVSTITHKTVVQVDRIWLTCVVCNRATFPDTTSAFHSRIALDVSGNSSWAASLLQSCTPSGPV